MKGYPNYGLKPGDIVKIKNGHDCRVEPSKIKVVDEYPTFILLQFIFRHENCTNSYLKCVNKGMIISGDVVMTKEGGAL